jgi:hypothetical protein
VKTPARKVSMAIGFETGKAALALNPKPAFCTTSAANSVPLPQSEPRALREHLVVSSIRSRDVGCAEWPCVRRFEHFLYLLDLVNNAFYVHASQSSSTQCGWVKRKRGLSLAIRGLPVHAPAPATTRAALANGHRVPCGHKQNTHNASTQTVRTARCEAMSLFGKSQTMRKRMAEATRVRCAVCVSGEG